jgi:hypothetical protein
MSNSRIFDKPSAYRIRVRGLMSQQWSDWFDHFEIQHLEEDTVLLGMVTDQAELHGLLAKIRDLGLPIISVERLDGEGDQVKSLERWQ